MKSTVLRLKQCLTWGVVLKIVDKHDREVPSATVGKIIARGPSAVSLCPHTVSGSIRIVRWSRAEAIIASVTCTTRKPSRPLAAGSRSSRMA
jgi:hypothetical protein